MHSSTLVAIILLGIVQDSIAGFGKKARDVEHGIENAVGGGLSQSQHHNEAALPTNICLSDSSSTSRKTTYLNLATVTITTIPDYCLTATHLAPGSPAAFTTTTTVTATASPPNVSSASSGVVPTLAVPIPLSGTQIFGPSIMQSIASQLSATAPVQVATQLPATALPATMGPVVVSNSTASITSVVSSSLSSTILGSPAPSTSGQSTSAPAPSTSARSDGKRVVTGGISTVALTVIILSGMQLLLS
ncbi:hypothetical protein MMC18_004531 [Xylographa bjoerkii]|nr:hypothetical protein [Xylographa bjoerkii]